MRADGGGERRSKDQPVLRRTMSLSLYGIPDGQQKGQSKLPCPSVYAPASALRSLSSVALSSAPASKTLSRGTTVRAIHLHFSQTISSTFLFEATNLIWSTFLREAIGKMKSGVLVQFENSTPRKWVDAFKSNLHAASSSKSAIPPTGVGG